MTGDTVYGDILPFMTIDTELHDYFVQRSSRRSDRLRNRTMTDLTLDRFPYLFAAVLVLHLFPGYRHAPFSSSPRRVFGESCMSSVREKDMIRNVVNSFPGNFLASLVIFENFVQFRFFLLFF